MKWELYAKYEDGTVINETRDYDENENESEQQYEYECALLEDNYYSFGNCIEYSVTLIYD